MNLRWTPTLVFCPPELRQYVAESSYFRKRETPTEEETAGVDWMDAFVFDHELISIIKSPEIEELYEKYYRLAENGRHGRLRIWIVLPYHPSAEKVQHRNEALRLLLTLPGKWRKELNATLSLEYLEINCLLLSMGRLQHTDPLIKGLKEEVNKENIQYTVLLNPYNYGWVNPGDIHIGGFQLFQEYGLRLIECMHIADLFLDDIAYPFNTILPDKYLFTVGSSIAPANVLPERLPPDTFTYQEQFRMKVRTVIEEATKQCKGKSVNLDISFSPLEKEQDDCFAEIEHEVKELDQHYENKGKPTHNAQPEAESGDRQKEKLPRHIEGISRVLLSNLEEKIGKYLNNGLILQYIRMDYFLAIAEEVTGRLLPDLLTVMKNEVPPEYESFRRIQGLLNSRLTKKRKEWEERYKSHDIPKGEKKALNEYFGEIRFEIRKALLGEGISSKVWWSKAKRWLRELSKGKSFMEDDFKIRNNRNKLLLKIAQDLLHLQFFAMRKEVLPEILHVSREGFETDKDKVVEEIREVFRPIRRLAEVINVNRNFDVGKLQQEVAVRMEALLEEMEVSPVVVSFDSILQLLVDAILSATDIVADTHAEIVETVFNPEFAPFMHSSVKIENYNPVYQCRFTNHKVESGSEVHRYAYSEKYTNHTLSVYGPWNENECLAYEQGEDRFE